MFFFKQKTAYEVRTSDWSSDVCSSDLVCSECLSDPAVGDDQSEHTCVKCLQGRDVPNEDADMGKVRAGKSGHVTLLPRGVLPLDRKSVARGKSVSVRVDLGGSRPIKTKKMQHKTNDKSFPTKTN